MDARLILHVADPFDGPMNMAIDQALLESVDRDGKVCLRFYRWRDPTLSLGYFQRSDDRRRHESSVSLPIVRRSTGGGAIVHDRELTYSLCLPTERSRRGAEHRVYDLIHDAIIRSLVAFGIQATRYRDSGSVFAGVNDAFLCFERRTDQDLVLSGYKIVGSAQRRSGSAILQHGSILLGTSRHAPSLPGVGSIMGNRVDPSELAQQIAAEIAASSRLQSYRDDLTGQEKQRAEQICKVRFGSDGWNHRR